MDSDVEELENVSTPDHVASLLSKLVDFADDIQQVVCDLVDLHDPSLGSLPHVDLPSEAEEDCDVVQD
jgi:hypothetical protein